MTGARYDLLLRGGRVLDPAAGLDAVRDVASAGGRIAAVAARLEPGEAARVFDATGMLVTPGLVDIHTHIYEAGGALSVPVDEHCLPNGVTTAVSAGDAGSATFCDFHDDVIATARTRVYGLVHIARMGLAHWPAGELVDIAAADPEGAAQTVRDFREACVGVKVRETTFIVGGNGLEPLRMAVAAAEDAGTRVMVHVYDIPSSLPELLKLLRPGDIVTHCYTGTRNGILDDDGHLLPAVLAGRRRGVLFDVGYGSKAGFSLGVARAALEQGFPPDTISSDLHVESVRGTMGSLPSVLAKFLDLGLTLKDVITCATVAAARSIDREPGLGTLGVGAPADVGCFRLREERHSIADDSGATMNGRWRLECVATVRAGVLINRDVPLLGGRTPS